MLKKIPSLKIYPFGKFRNLKLTLFKVFHKILVGSVPLFDMTNPAHSWMEYGIKNQHKVWRFSLLNASIVAISDPILMKKIVSDAETYQRGKFVEIDNVVLNGKMLFAIDGDLWKKMRTSVNYYFSKKNIEKYLNHIAECSEKTVKNILSQKKFDAKVIFTKSTLGKLFFFPKLFLFFSKKNIFIRFYFETHFQRRP